MLLELQATCWQVINDGVMGGLSRSEVLAHGAQLVFRGILALENNGGFASTRCRFSQDFSGVTGFRLDVRGDGRPYQFRLRTDESFDGIAWRADFMTDGTQQLIDLALGEFQPVFRGRKVKHAGALDPAKIRLLGFMLADRKAGPFELRVHRIETMGEYDSQPS